MSPPVERPVRLPPPGASDAEVRSAYRAFVRTHHPDLGGDPVVFRAGMESFERIRRRGSRSPVPELQRRPEFADVVHATLRIIGRIIRKRRYINLS